MAKSVRVANPKTVVMGDEPSTKELVAGNLNYSLEFTKALNWYSIDGNKVLARKYIKDYVKRNKLCSMDTFDSIPDRNIINTFGWIARLLSRGAILSNTHVEQFNNYIMDLISYEKKRTVVADVVNKEQVIKNNINTYIGSLEGEVDRFLFKDETDFNIKSDLMRNEIPQTYASSLLEWAKNKLKEFIEVIESKDKDLVDGYSNITKRKQKEFAKFMGQIITQTQEYGNYKKANRKPRAIKQKTPLQQTKNIKYLQKFDELELESISPVEIVGSQSIWLYNTKTRKLILYKSDQELGLTVKGQTIQNYNSEESGQKTLRNPKVQLKDMLSQGKVALRKYLDTIKTTKQQINGRINQDTIILRAIK